MRTSSITPFEVFRKGFVNIRYDNVSFFIVEDTIWLHLGCIYFLVMIAFWFVKCLFPIYDDTLN